MTSERRPCVGLDYVPAFSIESGGDWIHVGCGQTARYRGA
jgi:hypothetical protein